MGDIEHRWPAVPAMGEQESTHRRGGTDSVRRGQGNRERDSRKSRERRSRRFDGGQGWVGLVQGVSQGYQDEKTGAVAPGVRHREATGGEDDRVTVDRDSCRHCHPPATRPRRQVGDCHSRLKARSTHPRQLDQPVPNVPGLVRNRKQLGRLRFLLERQPEFLLEEGDLLPVRPGTENLLQRVGGTVGDETRLHDLRRQDVAASTAADQDFPSAIPGALNQPRLRACGGGKDCGHGACGTGAHHHDHAAGAGSSRIHPGKLAANGYCTTIDPVIPELWWTVHTY